MGHVHLSRREILQSLPLLGSGAMLAPLWGERPDTKTPGVRLPANTECAPHQITPTIANAPITSIVGPVIALIRAARR